MQTFDDRTRTRLVKLQISLEALSNIGYLLTNSKPLTDDQIAYCVMLDDEITKLKSLLFESTPDH